MSNDKRLLRGIDGYEQVVAKALAVLVCLVIAAATLQLGIGTALALLDWQTNWLDGQLLTLLDKLLLILIALEVLQNLTAYLRDHVVQVELVLLTSITAVARKVIVMPQHTEVEPWVLASLGFTLVTLSAAYWLMRTSLSKTNPQGLQ